MHDAGLSAERTGKKSHDCHDDQLNCQSEQSLVAHHLQRLYVVLVHQFLLERKDETRGDQRYDHQRIAKYLLTLHYSHKYCWGVSRSLIAEDQPRGSHNQNTDEGQSAPDDVVEFDLHFEEANRQNKSSHDWPSPEHLPDGPRDEVESNVG